MRRGNETTDHIALKQEAFQTLKEAGWIPLAEHLNCDVVAINLQSAQILSVEIERSSKNLENNIKRNIRQGAHLIAIISFSKATEHWQNRIDRIDAGIPIKLFCSLSDFQQWLRSQ